MRKHQQRGLKYSCFKTVKSPYTERCAEMTSTALTLLRHAINAFTWPLGEVYCFTILCFLTSAYSKKKYGVFLSKQNLCLGLFFFLYPSKNTTYRTTTYKQ